MINNLIMYDSDIDNNKILGVSKNYWILRLKGGSWL